MKTIEISLDVYNKLYELATGFDDTPNLVIQRLINHFYNSQKIPLDNKLNKNKHSMDYTKYNFNGHFGLPKRRLVLEVVKQFVADNEGISFQDLEAKFPKSLQDGPYGVFDTFEQATKTNDRKNKRFYTNPEQLVQLSDASIAVCNQWHIWDMKEFIKQATKLGYVIGIDDNS